MGDQHQQHGFCLLCPVKIRLQSGLGMETGEHQSPETGEHFLWRFPGLLYINCQSILLAWIETCHLIGKVYDILVYTDITCNQSEPSGHWSQYKVRHSNIFSCVGLHYNQLAFQETQFKRQISSFKFFRSWSGSRPKTLSRMKFAG